ncbi:extracellular solute-binding protein [Angelakisella massiliensis]|uniref:extracellular solute-binding protein n=1 Tax=Angelakisella massiliensis TaxID=1871018 RepID=UPI0008F81F84|nr:extracellular solute-binding protein [Angelakisella massiliensis]
MKRFLSVLTALAMLTVSMAGCGGSTASSSSSEAAGSSSAAVVDSGKRLSDTDVAIDFWHHMEGTSAVALENTVNNFNETVGKEYGIVVTPSFQGTNTAEKLKTLAQAEDWGNFPDVCQVASAGIPVIAGYDLLVKPEDMYAAGENIIVPREDILDNAARTFTYMDELCALPFSNSAILLYYNKDLFQQAGIETPPATIAEMVDAINKLTVKNGDEVETYGLEVQVKRYQLLNFLGGMGEYNFLGDNEGGRTGLMTKTTIGEDGSLMKFLDEWEKVIATGGYKAVEDNINEEFAMGMTAMAIMSSARIAKVDELTGGALNYGTAALPTVSADDKGGVAVGGSGVVIFNKGDELRQTAAWIFQQYLAGEDAQYTFCTGSGYIPINRKLYESERMQTFLAENEPMQAAATSMQNSNPNVQEPFDMVTGEIDTIIDTEMQNFAQGQDKQTTHDNIVNQINSKLAEYVEVNS